LPIGEIMRLHLVYFCFLWINVLLCQPTTAQWTWQNPLPTGNTYRGCDFLDTQTGWIVGGYGCILKTTDGGTTWVLQNSGVTTDLYGVYFLDENYGWAVGNGATILHTKNGGNDWMIQHGGSGSGSYINSVYFSDSLHGWTDGTNGGGQYFETTDGGNTWLWRSIPGVSYSWELSSMFFTDSLFFWALTGVDQISHTEDGGNTWITGPSPTGWGEMFFVNHDTGWMTDSHRIYRTTDRALTWEEQLPMQGPAICDLYFTDALHGWAGGEGLLLKTADGGESWESYETDVLFLAIEFSDMLNGWAVGGWAGELYHTLDGGNTWEDKRAGSDGYITAISFGSPDFGLASYYEDDYHSLLMTTDGGAGWDRLTILEDSIRWNALWVEDDINAWACGDDGTIVHSDDRGQSWVVQREEVPGDWFSELQFLDPLTGFSVGIDAGYTNILLARTYDGGQNWFTLPFHYSASPQGMWFTDPLKGFLVATDMNTDAQVLLTTYSGGESWIITDLPLDDDEDASSVCFTTSLKGFIGADNCILRTYDGGQNWERYNINGGQIFSLSFPDSLNGWCIGKIYSDRAVLRTNNGGESWAEVPVISDNTLTDLAFTAPDNGWICGYDGLILKWGENNPVSIRDDDTPVYVSVPLISPNPASHWLNIDLTVFPENQKISYRIFNIQGEEIGAGSYQKKGSHDRLTIDIKAINNGIYIVELAMGGERWAGRFVVIK